MNLERKIPLTIICLCLYTVCLWSLGNDHLIKRIEQSRRHPNRERDHKGSLDNSIKHQGNENQKFKSKKEEIVISKPEDEVLVTKLHQDLKARMSNHKNYKPISFDSNEGQPLLKDHTKLKEVSKLKNKQENVTLLIKNTVTIDNSKKDEIPLILIWNEPEHGMTYLQNNVKCGITANRSMLQKSSAVVVSYSGNKQRIYDFPDPKLRKSSQYFIMQLRETPAKYYTGHKRNHYMDGPKIKGVFNGTMYFRRDSDIRHYFGNFENSLILSYENGYNNLAALLANKTHLAAWAVSNCDHTFGAQRRLDYGKMLINKGLNVTTFGDCFNNNNKHEDRFGFYQYKFYLSFENSLHCPDYITEKFWKNGINTGAVPIVYGPTKEDVEAVAPPHSYIHVDDFATPAKLIKHINYLNENDEAYLEYHKWRLTPAKESIKTLKARYGAPLRDVGLPLSEFFVLCNKLINKELKPKIIHNMTDWVFGKDKYVDDLCLTDYSKPKHTKI